MIYIEILVLLGAIYLGVRLGGMAIGYAGGLGVIVLTLLGLKSGSIPWDVILIIMSVIAAITAMQVAGGLDYLVQIASRILRKHPKHINFLAPTVTWLLTLFAGTGHTAFSMIPVITEGAKGQNIRPCVPLSIAVVASQIAITASPVSAAVVFMASDAALGGLGIDYPILLLIWMPTTFLGCMITAAIMNMFWKMDLSKDENYLKLLAEGLTDKAEPVKEVELPASAKRSVWIFLIGVVAVVFYASAISNNVQLIKPSVIVDYENVYQNDNAAEFDKLKATLEVKQDEAKGAYVAKPKKVLALPRDHAIISFMMAIATFIVILCKVDIGKLPSTTTFRSGMTACVCVLGVAWLGDTFVSNHTDEIKGFASDMVRAHPWTLAVALFFASMLLYSQAATARALIPAVIVALGMTASNNGDAYIIVASFARKM